MKRKELEKVQMSILQGDNGDDTIQNKRYVLTKLIEMFSTEKGLYKQKSMVQWLREKDANTKFFHNMVVVKQKSQSLRKLKEEHGNVIKYFKDISIGY